jgi:hypothetical protein
MCRACGVREVCGDNVMEGGYQQPDEAHHIYPGKTAPDDTHTIPRGPCSREYRDTRLNVTLTLSLPLPLTTPQPHL